MIEDCSAGEALTGDYRPKFSKQETGIVNDSIERNISSILFLHQCLIQSVSFSFHLFAEVSLISIDVGCSQGVGSARKDVIAIEGNLTTFGPRAAPKQNDPSSQQPKASFVETTWRTF